MIYILIGAVVLFMVVAVIACASANRARTNLASYQAAYRHTAADLKAARADSLRRSRSVVSGQVLEHLAPFFPGWPAELSPRNLHHIGKPVDYLHFAGLDGDGEVEVDFVEVKTGTSRLNLNERRVRDAIDAGRVNYRVVWLSTEPPELTEGEQGDSKDEPWEDLTVEWLDELGEESA